MTIEDMESELKRKLAKLRAEYERRAQPIIDELVRLEHLKPRYPIHFMKSLNSPDENWVRKLGSQITMEESQAYLSGDFEAASGAVYKRAEVEPESLQKAIDDGWSPTPIPKNWWVSRAEVNVDGTVAQGWSEAEPIRPDKSRPA